MLRTFLVLLLPLLVNQLLVTGSVTNSVREECPSGCVDGCSKRTLFSIIWGCLTTTIICAWTTIHPNIPPHEGPLKATLRRLELMFWTIVGPEILPTWALNQRLAAGRVRDVYNNGKGYEEEKIGIWVMMKRWVSFYEIKEAPSQAWTLTHGHFVVMGGVHLVEPKEDTSTAASAGQKITTDEEQEHGTTEKQTDTDLTGRVTVLTLGMLRELVKDPEFTIQITQQDIIHRSKGDALSKLIFALQTSWFIVQSIARWAQGLELTLLELTTLALASLNWITFALWWDKPLGAQAVVRVYLNRRLTDKERDIEEREDSIRTVAFTTMRNVCVWLWNGIRDIIFCRSEHNVFIDWLIRLPLMAFPLVGLPIIIFGVGVFATANDILGGAFSFRVDDTHVPTFYVPGHRSSSNPFHMFLLMTLAVIFGGIHCAGWHFAFFTFTQQKMWRVASLAVAILPIVSFPLAAMVSYIFNRRAAVFKGLFVRDSDYQAGFTFFIVMVSYAVARLVLIGVAIASLWHQPPSTFTAIDWASFYPHIL